MTPALYVCLAIAFVAIARLAAVCRAAIKEQRHTDSLTGLPNRSGFEAIVAEHLKYERPFAIVWLGFDGFRKLNELRGHASGDILLVQAGPRIRRFLRPGDAAARFGGDQFLILLRGHDAVSGIVTPILSALHASAGVSLYPNHGDSVSELLLFAETAMRQAKAGDCGRAVFYDPSMAASGVRSTEIASLIRSALANERFRLVYQPVVDADGEIVRMEALVRIDDPVLGRVAPGEFIGVAEQTGLIHGVGGWILRQACRQACDWRDAGFETQVTINLSPFQLASNKLVDAILDEISECGLERSAITVHIAGVVRSTGPVERLRSAGVHISSQYVLSQSGVEAGPLFDEIRVSAPFKIRANRPQLTLVARGIETPEQLDAAHAAGCHLFQGFQIAPPLESDDATEILRTGLFAGVGGGIGLVRR